ncbi:hypothetical protein [Chitinophaga sp.]|uniref:hypothetical protein n=1 Tax=Chitinophaga sp. TaxID=1869181 RepID=UPI00262A0576|nr:hypothetical protein [uncultured Chitinophaga sp.]
MPLRAITLALLTVLLFSAGCSSETEEPDRRFISFRMNDEIMLSEQTNLAYYSPGDITDTDPTNDKAQLLIQGATGTKDVVYIHVLAHDDKLVPGVYTNAQPGNAFTMERFPSKEFLKADETSGTWSVTVHRVTGDLVEGEFLGTAVSMDLGTIHTISHGYFKVKYRVAPPLSIP